MALQFLCRDCWPLPGKLQSRVRDTFPSTHGRSDPPSECHNSEAIDESRTPEPPLGPSHIACTVPCQFYRKAASSCLRQIASSWVAAYRSSCPIANSKKESVRLPHPLRPC